MEGVILTNIYQLVQGIGLAIEALHALLESSSTAGAKGCRLVVAGGYDSRLAENVEHLLELQQLASELGVQDKVCVPAVNSSLAAANEFP